MIQYKGDILRKLKEAGYSTYKLQNEKLLSLSRVHAIRTGSNVSLSTLNTLCSLLNCQPGDILEFVPDGSETRKTE